MPRDYLDRLADELVEAEGERVRAKEPSIVREAWLDPYGHRFGVLFRYACPTFAQRFVVEGECSCLTIIRSGDDGSGRTATTGRVPVAFTPELTAAIRADDTLPTSITGLEGKTGEALQRALTPFKEWRRRLDRLFQQPRTGVRREDVRLAE